MPPKPLSAEYFDGWYADRVARLTVDEIMNRHMGFPPGMRAGVVTAEAIPDLAGELRLTPGSTLLDRALRSFHAEGVKSRRWTGLGLLRRVPAVATEPQQPVSAGCLPGPVVLVDHAAEHSRRFKRHDGRLVMIGSPLHTEALALLSPSAACAARNCEAWRAMRPWSW